MKATLHFNAVDWMAVDVESEGHDLDGTRRLITNVGTVRWTNDKPWIFWRPKSGESKLRVSDLQSVEIRRCGAGRISPLEWSPSGLDRSEW